MPSFMKPCELEIQISRIHKWMNSEWIWLKRRQCTSLTDHFMILYIYFSSSLTVITWKRVDRTFLQKRNFCFQHKSVSHKGLKQHDRFFISGWTIPLRPCQLPLVSILSFSSTSIHSCNRPSADSQVFGFQFLLPLHILIVYLSCLAISCLILARSSPLSLWRGWRCSEERPSLSDGSSAVLV